MKILIVSQHIYPMQTPRAHRTTELAKELARQGNEVTVYAVLGKYDYSYFEKEYGISVRNIKLKWQYHPYSSDGDNKRYLIDKLFGKLFSYYFEFPNIEFAYILKSILKNDLSYDAIISIADPHHIHWGIANLKDSLPNTFPKVWIADCGDPFMSNNKTKEHRRYFEKQERHFCSACNYITVPHSDAIEAYYEDYRKKIHIIPQGFNFELNSINTEPKNEVPTFAYAGMFIKDIRNPKSFLKILNEISLDFRFIIYTPYTDLIDPYIGEMGTKVIVKKPIKRDRLLDELKKMDFLINIENYNAPEALPSKVIDYAIAGRPILSFNQENITKEEIIKFLNKDYSSRYSVDDLHQYHISNVAKKFIKLIKDKNK